jgi:hypothetical protein
MVGTEFAYQIIQKLMKSVASHTEHDQNWHWPEKTWFRERLNAVKAQEHEQRRKSWVSAKTPEQNSTSLNADKRELKVD